MADKWINSGDGEHANVGRATLALFREGLEGGHLSLVAGGQSFFEKRSGAVVASARRIIESSPQQWVPVREEGSLLEYANLDRVFSAKFSHPEAAQMYVGLRFEDGTALTIRDPNIVRRLQAILEGLSPAFEDVGSAPPSLGK